MSTGSTVHKTSIVVWCVTRVGTGLARSLYFQTHQAISPTTSRTISDMMTTVYQLNHSMYSITWVAGACSCICHGKAPSARSSVCASANPGAAISQMAAMRKRVETLI
jgi:hypothetical protein